MKARVITLIKNEYSEACADRCIASAAEFGVEVEKFPGTPKEEAEQVMGEFGLEWTFPVKGESICPTTGLRLRAYSAKDIRAKYGCSMSHYRLWSNCARGHVPYLILEHDAVFLGPLPSFDFKSACMVNDPAGATPRGGWWSDRMRERGPGVFPVTHVFPDDVPDGLAGNSAYLICPSAAGRLINAFHNFGVWPNDATMCRQLVHDLQELYPFVTRVEQAQSTTTR